MGIKIGKLWRSAVQHCAYRENNTVLYTQKCVKRVDLMLSVLTTTIFFFLNKGDLTSWYFQVIPIFIFSFSLSDHMSEHVLALKGVKHGHCRYSKGSQVLTASSQDLST